MMYYYILGFGIACLVLFGIGSMETVCVKPAEMLVKALLWPVTLMEAVVNYSSTHHNYKAALYNTPPSGCSERHARLLHPQRRSSLFVWNFPQTVVQ